MEKVYYFTIDRKKYFKCSIMMNLPVKLEAETEGQIKKWYRENSIMR
jgi:hypothetical protein